MNRKEDKDAILGKAVTLEPRGCLRERQSRKQEEQYVL